MAKKSGEHEITDSARSESAEEFADRETSHGTALFKEVKDDIMTKADPKKAVGFLRKRPAVGVVIASGVGFAAANAIGVGELAIAMAAGYMAYRALTS